ncbi:TIGR04282 family arsenosugar biosynthesis glycosyltransferase [Pararhodonellum marinum]|uniref:TIGR04282 family arsenosugar biosynthesis glycosyltransferase n=1 Tax=Pararhodonellum marinum TaxID=2755358 RepID=UPI0018904E98|nr:TIGR04282 family arsenosugar biosynthesis glycosyltransferase [Pararhodonellum marinum]
MTDTLVVIFLKPFILGTVKTRLAKEIGSKQALAVYQHLVKMTLAEVEKVNKPIDVKLFYSRVSESSLHPPSGFSSEIQTGQDLGIRMYNAMRYGKAHGYEKVIIIGSDCPEMKSDCLENAVEMLDRFDLVLGPASDGGYYLIGAKEAHQDIFQQMPWSTDKVLSETLSRSKAVGLHSFLLPTLSDIDELDDLKAFPELMALIAKY